MPISKGYTVGGTIHIIANNLLGFTTLYSEEHSSRFSAQLARRQSIPIFHVNAEDVDAVVRVAPPGAGVSLRLERRRGDRPDRLPPPRSQRSR